MIKFLFSKASLHAKCEVIKYVISLHRKSDDEIIAAVNHELMEQRVQSQACLNYAES